MAGQLFGEAYVQISPKMDDFGAAIKRAVGGIKDITIPVSFKIDSGHLKTITDDLSKPLPLSITPKVDTATARKALAELDKPLPLSVVPKVDSTEAKKSLSDLDKPISMSVIPNVDNSQARKALSDLDKPIPISVTPKLDDVQARRGLADLEKPLSTSVNVRLDGNARGEIADLVKPESKTIEVDVVAKGGGDPFEDIVRGGTKAGDDAGRNVTAAIGGSIGRGMKGPAAAIVTGLGLKAIVDTGGDFQVAMAKIQAQTGASADQMAKVDAITLQLGKDQKLGAASAGDAAEAIQVLTKGQFSLSEAMDISRNALQLSIVSQQDAATASGQLATAMAQLKIPVADAAKVVDSLAAADLKGIIGNASDYATAIQYAGSQWTRAFSDQAPLDRMYDLQTALVTLDNEAGITGSKAGTTIRRMMIDMTGPTNMAAKGIANLTTQFEKNGGVLRDGGNIFFTSTGQMRPMPEAIDNINTSLKDLGGNAKKEMERLEPIFTTVGKDGVDLLRQGRDKWDEYGDSVRRAGVTSQLSDAYATGLKGAFAGLSGALETTAIQTAKAISPLLIPAITGVGTAISGLGTILPPVISGIGFLVDKLANSAPVQGFLDVMGRLKGAIGSIFEKPSETGSYLVNQFLAGQTAGDKLRFAMQRIRDEFPLVDRAATIFETSIRPKIEAVARFVTGTLIPALGKIGEKVIEISGDVGRVGAGIVEFFARWDTKAKLVAGALTGIAAGIVTTTLILPAFTAAVGIATGALGGIAAVIGVITSPVTLLVAGLVGLGIAAKVAYDNIRPFHQAVDLLWQGFQKLSGIRPIMDGISQAFRGIKDIAAGAIGGIASLVTGDFSGAWEGLKRTIGGVKDAMIGMGKITFGPLIAAVGAINRALGDPLGKLKEIGGKVWKATVNAGGNAVEWIGARLGDLNRIKNTAWRAAVSAGGAAAQWLGARLGELNRIKNTAWNATVRVIGNALQMIGAIKNALSGIKDKTVRVSVNTVQTVTSITSASKAGVSPANAVPGVGAAKTAVNIAKKIIGKAVGGPVSANNPYIVGEIGPELFVPKVSGTIVTNADLERLIDNLQENAYVRSFSKARVASQSVRTSQGVSGIPIAESLALASSSFVELVDKVDDSTDALDDLIDKVDEVGGSSAEYVASIGGATRSVIGEADNFGTALGNAAYDIGGSASDIGSAADDLTGNLGDTAKSLEPAGPLGSAVSDFRRIIDKDSPVADAVDDLATGAGDAAKALDPASPLGNALGEFRRIVGEGATEVGTATDDLGVDLGDLGGDASGLGTTLINVGSNIETAGLGLGGDLGELGGKADTLGLDLGDLGGNADNLGVDLSGLGGTADIAGTDVSALGTAASNVDLSTLSPPTGLAGSLSGLETAADGAATALGTLAGIIASIPSGGGYGDANGDGVPDAFAGATATIGGGPFAGAQATVGGSAASILGGGATGGANSGFAGYAIGPGGQPIRVDYVVPPAGSVIPAATLPAGADWTAFIGGNHGTAVPAIAVPPGFDWTTLVGHADGGPVLRGVPSIVGERGPELFVPRLSGDIISNEDSRALLEGNSAPPVTVVLATEIPAWQMDLMTDRVAEKIAQAWAERTRY